MTSFEHVITKLNVCACCVDIFFIIIFEIVLLSLELWLWCHGKQFCRAGVFFADGQDQTSRDFR